MPLGEAKDYLYALPGSYWIYKNTVTGELDTQICVGFICDTIIRKGTQNYSRHITIEYERIKRVIESTFSMNIFYEETSFYNPDAPRPLSTILNRHVDGHSTSIFLNPFISGGGGSASGYYQGMDSTLVIQGKLYYNVAKFELDIDGIWENSPPFTGSQYYWAKDVGLVKRLATARKDEWELINYQIIK